MSRGPHVIQVARETAAAGAAARVGIEELFGLREYARAQLHGCIEPRRAGRIWQAAVGARCAAVVVVFSAFIGFVTVVDSVVVTVVAL